MTDNKEEKKEKETSKENEEYTEVENKLEFWSPEVGDSVSGVIVDSFKGNFSEQTIIETEEETRIVLPGHAILKGLLTHVVKGDSIKVECTGRSEKSEKGKNPAMLYKLFTKN